MHENGTSRWWLCSRTRFVRIANIKDPTDPCATAQRCIYDDLRISTSGIVRGAVQSRTLFLPRSLSFRPGIMLMLSMDDLTKLKSVKMQNAIGLFVQVSIELYLSYFPLSLQDEIAKMRQIIEPRDGIS